MSSHNIQISVIMTVYNGEKFLRDAIYSILKQTFKDFELIIIDDGSTDSTLQIIKSYEDSRIRLFENGRNRGQSYSRNLGINVSNGQYIAIMDADDVALPNRLEIQIQYLKSNTEVSLCGSWIEVISEENEFKKIRKVPTENFEIKADLIFNCPIIHPTVMFVKKDFVFNNFFYNEEFKYSQDMELWTRAMFKLNFYNIPLPLLKMRYGNSNSISFKHVTEQQYFGVLIVNNTLNRLGIREKWDFNNSFYCKILIYKMILKSEYLKVPPNVLKNKLMSYFPKRYEKLVFSLLCLL